MTRNKNETGGRTNRKRKWVLRVASRVLVLIGAVALSYSGYVFEDARTYQEIANRNFENAKRQMPDNVDDSILAESETLLPTTPAGAATARGIQRAVIGRLEVPRLGVQVMLVEGDSNNVLQRAVAHLRGTPLPGEIGNVGLAGHRDTYFRPLRNIRAGDVISIETLNASFRYRVEWIAVVPPDNVSILTSSESHELTLVTCFPFDYIGPAPNRFVVRAREIEKTIE